MLGITKGLSTWKNPQEFSIERFTDNASYTSAHPDDTLVLAGPPRFSSVMQDATAGWQSLLAIGMVTSFQFGSQKPTQPMQAIGSGRSYFVSSKSMTSWRIGRLFCNGRNLLRVLYHNAVSGGVPVENFDDSPVANNSSDMYFINLDSELYYIPMGVGIIFKDKIGNLLGAVYMELSMIQSYGVGFNAGQAMVMEDVSAVCDRVLPWHPTAVTNSEKLGLRQTVDQVVGFINGDNMPHNGTGLITDDLNVTDRSM
jgi:hypothetical protein